MAKKKEFEQRSLGGLADALLKAGVIDTKTAGRARTEQRQEDKQLGKDGVAARETARQERFAEARAQQGSEARQREREHAGETNGERAIAAIRNHAERGRGNKRWFFVARDGRIPFVDVPDGIYRALGDGAAGIVESLGTTPDEHVVISGSEALGVVKSFDAEAVRFWNQPS